MTSRYFKTSAGRTTRKTVQKIEELVEEAKQPNAPAQSRKKKSIKIEYDEAAKKPKEGGWEPDNWLIQLENIRQMRKEKNAPVDTMGCEKISDSKATPAEYRYQVLLSLMLSSQTKDEITSAAMAKLREYGCRVDHILKTENKKLEDMIYPVGFYKRKADYIKRTSAILKSDYESDIPKTVKELCKLPGVGPKMAHLVMKVAWHENTGIGTDVHVHRIANRLGWAKTKEPEKTEEELQSWVPKHLWPEVNWLLVGFGQQICLPVHPKCTDCLNRTVCPFPKKVKD